MIKKAHACNERLQAVSNDRKRRFLPPVTNRESPYKSFSESTSSQNPQNQPHELSGKDTGFEMYTLTFTLPT